VPAVLLAAAIALASGAVAQARGHGGGHHYGSIVNDNGSHHSGSIAHHSGSHHSGSIAHHSGSHPSRSSVHLSGSHHSGNIAHHNRSHHYGGPGHHYGAVAQRSGAPSTSHLKARPRSVTPWYAKFDPNHRDAKGRIHRSAAARERFEAMTGYPHGWPGHVVDHVKPLACGGVDDSINMQWQTVAEAKAKDKWERNGCRSATHGRRR
jgi:hypothetical protein